MDLVDFLYQAGSLKDVDRSGWRTVGIKPESVSEHSYRTALIAYFLAKEEGIKDLEGVLLAALLHDVHEALTMDLHLVAKRYSSLNEEKARKDSIGFSTDLLKPFRDKRIMQVVKDADKLECVFQAKEYQDLGNPYVKDWIKNASESLKTDSAKSLCKKALKRDAFNWLFEARK
ncbi:HD domain-containing protein [Candidatus Micrarchaeota archaeon]|nr:HD domain-containing protein [Candidatus Micrarchaeota archaeon]MBD3417952.1 HD domain-containing protein [Candidatus Micrarchaeota archaeon]